MKRCAAFVLLFFCCIMAAFAQFYDSGQDPASFRWKQIKTPHFNILYPDTAENIARHLSRTLEAGYEKGAWSLQVAPKKITVLLHPSSVFSNAYVAWAPRRMEFVTTPPQENDAQDWVDQLATHEYRHLVQLTSVNRGLTRVLSWFFGEQITAGVMGTFVPFWFIEGDATLTETLLSKAGRGRLPSFDVGLRAQLLEKGAYSYDKAVFGSYKDFVPDHYVLGYHLVTMSRREFGSEMWDRALHQAGACPVMITPFNHGIRQTSKLSKVKLYKHCMQQLDSLWRSDLQQRPPEQTVRISHPARHYTSYSQPVMMNRQQFLVYKTGFDDTRKVVSMDMTGQCTTLFHAGGLSSASLSAAGNLILWAEAGYDPRWENRNYSNIWSYDMLRKKKKKLTSRSRLFAPDLSPDGRQFVCVSVNLNNINTLEIRDARTAQIIRHYIFPEGTQVMTPSWSKDGNKIVMVTLKGEGKELTVTDTLLTQIIKYHPRFFNDISDPVMANGKIVFSSGSYGTDNIYLLNTTDTSIRQITSAKYGAYQPDISLNEDTVAIVYSEYTPDGNALTLTEAGISSPTPVALPDAPAARIFEPLHTQELGIITPGDSIIDYPSKRYYKFLHLFNPHSWGPISVNAERQTVNPGITLMSQNKLTTLVSTAGWEYSVMQKTGTWFADVSFRQWYPIIDVKFSWGERSALDPNRDTNNRYHWAETSLRTSARIPLNLSSGAWNRWLQLRLSSTFYKIDRVYNYPEYNFKGYFRTLDYQLYWSSSFHSTQKDIEPRWGQMLILDYRHTPLDGIAMGGMFAARTSFYFPGIGRHHNFYVQASFQQNTEKPFKYSDIITYPRGIRNAYDDSFISLSGNYTLPLLYPDLHCGSVFYMKRIWMNAFFDHAYGRYHSQRNTYSSTGAELYTNIHLFRFLAPFSIGFRGSWVITEKSFIPEFLYSVNLSGIQ